MNSYIISRGLKKLPYINEAEYQEFPKSCNNASHPFPKTWGEFMKIYNAWEAEAQEKGIGVKKVIVGLNHLSSWRSTPNTRIDFQELCKFAAKSE